jgi:hypothetical protein
VSNRFEKAQKKCDYDEDIDDVIDHFIDELRSNIPAGSGIELIDASIRDFDMRKHGLHTIIWGRSKTDVPEPKDQASAREQSQLEGLDGEEDVAEGTVGPSTVQSSVGV